MLKPIKKGVQHDGTYFTWPAREFSENYFLLAYAVCDSIPDNQPQELAALLAKYPREAKRLLHEKQEFPPMWSAIRYSRPDIVDVLLNSGINIERTDNEGYTALIRAANVQEWDIVDRLLQVGADVTTDTPRLIGLSLSHKYWNREVNPVRWGPPYV